MSESKLRRMLRPGKEVTFEQQGQLPLTLTLRPLSAEYLADYLSVLRKIAPLISQDGKAELSGEAVLSILDPETVETLRSLCEITLQNACPEEDKGIISQLVAENFMILFPAIIEINVPAQGAYAKPA